MSGWAPNEVVEQEVFFLRGIPHYPHYTIAGAFVAPGGVRYFTRAQLISRGAIAGQVLLWPREYTK
jgi:hypothetical protein